MIMTEDSWPKAFMASMNASKRQEEWAEGMTFITYMKYDDVASGRILLIQPLKKMIVEKVMKNLNPEKQRRFLKEIELKFPGIKDCIDLFILQVPLSYRDYIGGDKGNMYGYVKDSNNPMKTLIASKTKLDNLYLNRAKHQYARRFGRYNWSSCNLF